MLKNLAKFGRVVFDVCEQTNRHYYRNILQLNDNDMQVQVQARTPLISITEGLHEAKVDGTGWLRLIFTYGDDGDT